MITFGTVLLWLVAMLFVVWLVNLLVGLLFGARLWDTTRQFLDLILGQLGWGFLEWLDDVATDAGVPRWMRWLLILVVVGGLICLLVRRFG